MQIFHLHSLTSISSKKNSTPCLRHHINLRKSKPQELNGNHILNKRKQLFKHKQIVLYYLFKKKNTNKRAEQLLFNLNDL